MESSTPFDWFYVRHARPWLVVVLLAYAGAASLFAIYTPDWQAPDEPAHYNYMAHIAQSHSLPVLQMGDYDQEQISLLLDNRFAATLSVAPLRYESYQPPLYYLVMTPLFWLTGGRLLALRLGSVVFGVATICLLYFCLETVFPEKTMINLGATAFAALLPMHVAMTAAVNNDGFAELLLMAAMLVLLRWMRDRFHAAAGSTSAGETWTLLAMGVLLGLGLLTKVYAYLLLPIVALTVLIVVWRKPRARDTGEASGGRNLWRGVRQALIVVAPALLLGLPLWIRNVTLYGRWDVLGMNWHDQVVMGQPRTVDWIAANGWTAYAERAFGFTFKSFWGVFGWMGVFMDERIYTVLLIFTGVIFLGLLWATVRIISGRPDTDMDPFQIAVLCLFAVMVAAVLVGYLWYNVKFVQHQGRYFFWGLLPISAFVALGWREVMRPLQGMITGFLAAVLAISIALAGVATGTMDKWTVLIIGSVGLLLMLQPLLLLGTGVYSPRRLQRATGAWLDKPVTANILWLGRFGAWASPFALLLVLDLLIPFVFIGPQLRV